MTKSLPFSMIVRKRYSCRTYDPAMPTDNAFTVLQEYISMLPVGPFNAPNRFLLERVNRNDRLLVGRLGTYGTIKDTPGFIIGVSGKAHMDMEDFGYRMEMIILKAAELDLGTCWLGGYFTRGSFSKKARATRKESLPAVTSVGFPLVKKTTDEVEKNRKRLPWYELFFQDSFSSPLDRENAGSVAGPLEMVRLAPSARNLQPWRVVKQGNRFHFFMQRYKGYRELVVPFITGIADLQRVDMGIAMAHFDGSLKETGLSGRWDVLDSGIKPINDLMEYSFSFTQDGSAC